ncbi:MAG: hypothetical protein ACRBBW_11900 [Cellvibrionaceae bacterium]
MTISTKSKIILLAVALCIIEISAALTLALLYLWVERDLCPIDFRASGHCYANWFEIFDSFFFSASLIILCSIFLWVIFTAFSRQQNIKRLAVYFIVLILGIFVILTEFHFITETAVAAISVYLWAYQLRPGIEK